MLERNILSHFKLAILLSLLSSSLLLNARLVPETKTQQAGSLPLSVVEFAAAIACIAAGVWEYYNGYRDLKQARAFLVAVKSVPTFSSISKARVLNMPPHRSHLSIMTIVAGVVFGTCIVFMLNDSRGV